MVSIFGCISEALLPFTEFWAMVYDRVAAPYSFVEPFTILSVEASQFFRVNQAGLETRPDEPSRILTVPVAYHDVER